MTQSALSMEPEGKNCHLVSISHQVECTIAADSKNSLLVQLGKHSPVLSGCKGGGCGKCRIKVTEGTYASKKMSRAHISARDEEQSIVLACRIFPRSDLNIIPLAR